MTHQSLKAAYSDPLPKKIAWKGRKRISPVWKRTVATSDRQSRTASTVADHMGTIHP